MSVFFNCKNLYVLALINLHQQLVDAFGCIRAFLSFLGIVQLLVEALHECASVFIPFLLVLAVIYNYPIYHRKRILESLLANSDLE
jgi:hypothetical protein